MGLTATIPEIDECCTGAPDAAVEYLRVLHSHGVGSPEAKAFKAARSDDSAFLRRATGAERLVQFKDEVLRELGSDPLGVR